MLEDIKAIINSPTKLAYILISGIIVISLLAIMSLVYIWTPKTPVNTETEAVIGEYEFEKYDEEYVINKYSTVVFNLLYNENIEDIYELLHDEYIEFNNIDIIALKNKLNNKGLLGESLKLDGYTVQPSIRNNKVIELVISNMKETINSKIILIEESVNHFKISLDGFVSDESLNETFISEGLKLTLKNRTEYSTRIIYNIELQNVSDHNIILNNNLYPECAYVLMSDFDEIRTSTIWFGSSSKELKVNSKLYKEIEFKIDNLEGGLVNGLYIKDVYDSLSKEEKDIYFQKFN